MIKGQDSTRAVIIGAHFDGAGANGDVYASGAIDNASGVATMLRAAQLLSEGEKPSIDVVICAFNGEEGSRRYGAEAVASDLNSLYEGCYYINVDCVGLVDNKPYQYRASRNRVLEDAFAAALQAAGYALSEDGIGGDWTPFEAAGVTAVSLAQETIGVRYTTADLPEAVDVETLQGLAIFLADFIRSSGDNIYAQDSNSAQSAEKKAVAQRQQLVDSLGLGFHDSYMYQLDGYYVCISGNRPVHTAEELKTVYPWIEVQETLGPYKLQEVLAVDLQTNWPFQITDTKTGRNLGPSSTWSTMPLNEVVRTMPGAVDSYHFVYEDSRGRCIGLSVSRVRSEADWESLSRYCVPLVSPSGKEIASLYVSYLQGGDSEQVAVMNYYTSGGYFVQIAEYDTDRPTRDSNNFGNYTCDMKPLSRQEAVELVKQLGLSGLEDYFSSLMRAPDDN